MRTKKIYSIVMVAFMTLGVAVAQNPVYDLVERIDKGSSRKFIFELEDEQSPEDYFEISTQRGKIAVVGNNYISVAVGLNWYLRNYALVQISSSQPTADLSDLPKVAVSERHSTELLDRYYFSLMATSQSSPFWDKKRWSQEVDFMALHGVTMPLVTTGLTHVWSETLLELGYSEQRIKDFLPHPSFESWWLDGKIEGWGSPTPEDFTARRAEIGAWVKAQCDEWGMTPVLVGYNGMVPRGTVSDSLSLKTWHGMPSPDFIDPVTPAYSEFAKVYYEKLTELYGDSEYYLVNPMEGMNQSREAGEKIFEAIQNNGKGARWVIGAWDKTPTTEMIDYIPRGGVVVLDSWADGKPQWGDKSSEWKRLEGFVGHQWIYCSKVNFGGNSEMYGNLSRLVGGYYLARDGGGGLSMVGVGVMNDATEGNQIMTDMVFDLPWVSDKINVEKWVQNYADARYGTLSADLREAWEILANTIYSPEYNSTQRGASQSIFAARPALEILRVNTGGETKLYYDNAKLREALSLMVNSSSQVIERGNFENDIREVGMRVLSNYAIEQLEDYRTAFNSADTIKLKSIANNFLEAMLLGDNLLNSHRETMLGTHIQRAMSMGNSPWERDWLRYGLRTFLSSWGSQVVGSEGEMHDTNYRLWGGLLADVYAKRWARFFNYVEENGALPIGYDYYDIESEWAESKNAYPLNETYDAVLMAREILEFTKIEVENTSLKNIKDVQN